jgi:hypothetical protein
MLKTRSKWMGWLLVSTLLQPVWAVDSGQVACLERIRKSLVPQQESHSMGRMEIIRESSRATEIMQMAR